MPEKIIVDGWKLEKMMHAMRSKDNYDSIKRDNAIIEFKKLLTDNISLINQEFKFRLGEMTMLMLAAQQGCTEAAEILIEYGADIEQRDKKYSKNALHYALEEGSYSFKTAIRLLELGADPDASYLNIISQSTDKKPAHPIRIIFNSIAGIEDNEAVKLLKAFNEAKADFAHDSLKKDLYDLSEIENRPVLKRADESLHRLRNNFIAPKTQGDTNHIKERKKTPSIIPPLPSAESNDEIYILDIKDNSDISEYLNYITVNSERGKEVMERIRAHDKLISNYLLPLKTLDFGLDALTFFSEPTLDNAKLAIRDFIYIQNIIKPANGYSFIISAIDVGHSIYYGEYSQAFQRTAATAIYTAVPFAIGFPLYTNLVLMHTVYNTAIKLHSHYNEYNNPVSKFKSKIAYGNLFNYYGFKDQAKGYFLDAVTIAKENQDKYQEIKQITEESNLCGILHLYLTEHYNCVS